MKQQHYEANRNPSKICRILFLVCTLKLGIAGWMVADALMETYAPEPAKRIANITGGTAHAAANTPAPAGAPPVIEPSATASPTADYQQLPSATNTAAPTSLPPARALPTIATPAVSNATATANTSASQDPLTREVLTRKQEELQRKEQELRQLEAQLDQKLQRMEMLENRLTVMMKEAENANDAKLRHLVDVLSNMKAKSAAQVLETLDPRISVKILANMRGRQAGEILTFVKPEVAASLSSALARMQLPLE